MWSGFTFILFELIFVPGKMLGLMSTRGTSMAECCQVSGFNGFTVTAFTLCRMS